METWKERYIRELSERFKSTCPNCGKSFHFGFIEFRNDYYCSHNCIKEFTGEEKPVHLTNRRKF